MLILNEQELRKYLPNAFATVEGETGLIEKLLPYLNESETWLCSGITGKDVLLLLTNAAQENRAKGEACRAVTCNALMHAIPALDVVLTPNGFGVVSNQNIAPASKDRVERLIDSVEMQRDDAVMHLMKFIQGMSTWQESEVFDIWNRTLFPDIGVTSQLGIRQHQFAEYLALVPQIMMIETAIANEFLSPELMKVLHRFQFGIGRDGLQPAQRTGLAFLITQLRPEIVAELKGKPRDCRLMADLVNMVRQRPELFPWWHGTATAELFAPPVFENRKKSGGYFF